VLVLEAEVLDTPLFRRIGGGAEGALLLELELESEGILYHLYSSSSSSLLERLVRESAGFDSLLDNLKLGKLNKSNSIVKVKG
jgi:hypothetical protein